MTEQQFTMEELGKLQFTILECASILNISHDELMEKMSDPSDSYRLSYERGRLQAIAEVRKMILLQAQNGDTTAQAEFVKLVDRARDLLPW